MSPVSFNEGNSVPGIAHCVVIESELDDCQLKKGD